MAGKGGGDADKFQANSDGWRPNWEDPNLSGKGHYGSCCSELAIW